MIAFILKICAFGIFYLMYDKKYYKSENKFKIKQKKFIKVHSVYSFVAHVAMETRVYFTGRLVLIGGNHGRNVSSH